MNFNLSFFLFFILIAMIYLIAKYFMQERTLHQSAELLHLIFFPITGYGNWMYNREIRNNGKTKYPLAWYIYKYMIEINVVIMSIIGLRILIAIADSAEVLGSASKENDHFALSGFALLLDGVIGIFYLIYIAIIFGIYVVSFILSIVIPKNLKKAQEKMIDNLHIEKATAANTR